MTCFTTTTLSPVEDGPQYGDMYNNTWTSSTKTFSGRPDQDFSTIYTIIFIFMSCIGIVGLVGNGIVICLLGFYVKRSPFTTYILNLVVTDFGFLLVLSLYCVLKLTDMGSLPRFLIFLIQAAVSMNTASQLLLTTISIDRCVSVLFPIWHRCHWPPHLSAIACTLMWVLSLLPSGSLAFLYQFGHLQDHFFSFLFIAGAVLCLPLVSISTMFLLFKVFCKPWQHWRGRLLTIILLTLLFFLIFAFPLNAIFTLQYFLLLGYPYLREYGYVCACLNSCVNPVIYYMVGRKKRGQQRQSLKVILQRAFKEEEEEHREE